MKPGKSKYFRRSIKMIPKRIMDRLREETKEYHSKLESLPYFGALIHHTLPLECYVSQLRALAVVHGVMETAIAASTDERVLAVWDDGLKKSPLLEQDLAFFAHRVAPAAATSIDAALAMAGKIRLRQAENPVTLLGYLYVFEGSTLGNSMHRPDISATFHLNNLEGCRYYASYRDQVQNSWQRFMEKMNRALDDSSVHDALIEAAHEAFSGLEKLYNALYPLSKKQKSVHVAQINPEAGNHPMPEDAREIEAALLASSRAWASFPYYEQRFGERGKRFSDSDACWLVTLTHLDPEAMQQQIDWIGRVLATRGMPTLMLEQTLRILYEELVRVVPENGKNYEKLLQSADILAAARENALPEMITGKLVDEFDRTAGADLVKTFQNAGKLMVAAVADEKNGTLGAVAALKNWLMDPARFPDQWIAAANRIIQKARQEAGS